MERSTDWLLALLAGVLLALMIDYNSLMAKHSTPLFASWLAHGIGTLGCLFLIVLLPQASPHSNKVKKSQGSQGPFWAYLGGVPGALTIVLAAITVNTRLGLSTSLALMLLGQILFGLVTDKLGLFGTPKRKFKLVDVWVVLSVLIGSVVITYFRT